MCPNKELLSAYFDGEIEPKWIPKIKEHIDTCVECQTYLSTLNHLNKTLLGSLSSFKEAESEKTVQTCVSQLIRLSRYQSPLNEMRQKGTIFTPTSFVMAAAALFAVMFIFFSIPEHSQMLSGNRLNRTLSFSADIPTRQAGLSERAISSQWYSVYQTPSSTFMNEDINRTAIATQSELNPHEQSSVSNMPEDFLSKMESFNPGNTQIVLPDQYRFEVAGKPSFSLVKKSGADALNE